MSRTVDKRVVEMEFDNAKFEDGVKESTSSLEKLKEALNFKSTEAGIQEFESSLNALKFDSIVSNLDYLANRFSTLGIVGMTAVQNITNKVIDLGTSIGTKLVEQIKTGGVARYQNIAQAKFQIEGLKKDWESLYEDMDYAVSGTAYGIDEAAAVASQLSASGIEAGDGMKAALRGVSGVAAMTNSTYSEIGNIFTTVAGNGRLMGMQLTQLASKGLNVAATLADAMETTESDIREMVSKGEISFEQFAQAMDDAFGEHSTEANKTFTGALSNMKSALSRIGENFARPIFENLITPLNTLRDLFNQVKEKLTVFTGTLNNNSWKNSVYGLFIERVSGLMDNMFKNVDLSFIDNLVKRLSNLVTVINIVIGRYSKNGGLIETLKEYANVHSLTDKRTKAMITVLEGLRNVGKAVNNVFTSVVRVIKAIMAAFSNSSDIAETADGFYELTEVLLKLSSSFYVTTERANKIYSLFKKLFDTLKYFGTMVKNVAVSVGNYLAPVLSVLFDIFLELTKTLGKIITKVGEFIKSNIDLQRVANNILKIYTAVKEVFINLSGVLRKVANWYSSLNDHTKKVILTLGALLVLGSRLISWSYIISKVFHNMILTINNTLKLASNLSLFFAGMKNFTKYVGIALIIKEIGIAIAILAGALFVLSLVDPNSLKLATTCIAILMGTMVAMAVGLTALAANVHNVNKINSYLLTLGLSFIAISAAILLLAKAVDTISGSGIGKAWNSLAILTIMIIELTAATVALSILAPVLSKGGIVLVAYAASIYILARALNEMSSVNLEGIIDKLVTLSLTMVAMVGIATLASKVSASGVLGVLIMITSLWLIEKALKYIVENGVSWDQVKENFDKLAVALGSLIALSWIMKTMTSDKATVKGAITIIALAGSLYIICKAFEKLITVTQDMRISNAIAALAAIFIGMIAVLKVLNEVDKNISKAGSAVLKIGITILLISASLALLSKINNPAALFSSVAAIGIILLSTAATLAAVSKLVQKTHIFSILSMTLMIAVIAASLAVLTFFSGEGGKVLQASAAIGVILLTTAATLAAVSKYSKGLNPVALTVLNTMIYVIISIAISLLLLSHVEDVDKMYHSVAAILLALISVVSIVLMFNKLSQGMDIRKLELFNVAVATLIVVAASMLMLNQFESIGKLYATVGAIGLCLLAIALAVIGVARFASSISVKAIVALGVAVLSLIVIATTLKMLLDGGYDWDEMKRAMLSLVVVLGSVVAALSILAIVSKLTAGVGVLLAGAVVIASLLALSVVMMTLGATVRSLVGSLILLTKIDYEAIRIDILKELCGVVLTFGLTSTVASVGLGLFGASLLVIGGALLVIAAAIALAVPRLTALVNAIILLGKCGTTVANGIKAVGKAISETINTIAMAIVAAFVQTIIKLASFSTVISGSVKIICDSIINILTYLIVAVAGILVRGLEALLKEIDEHLPNILTSLKSIIVTCLKFLVQMIPTLAYTGGLMISGFLVGVFRALEQKLPEITDASVELALSIIWAITDALYEHQDDITDAIQGLLDVIGLTVLNMLDTLTGHLLSKMDWYQGTMDELGAEIEEMSARRGKREAEANTDAFIEETEASKDKIKDAKANNIADTSNEQAKAGNKDASSYVDGAIDKLADGDINDAMMDEWMNSDSINIEDFASKYSGDVTESTAEGIKENSSVVTDAFSNMPAEAAEEMRKHGVDLESVGADMDQSVADGVESSDATTEGASSAFDKILGVFNSEDSSAKLNSSGSNSIGQYVTGLISGAEDSGNQSKLKTAVQNMVQTNVVDATNETLDVNSPSKVAIAIGKYWDLGLGQGITEYGKVIYNASEDTASNLTDTFSNALNNVNKGINGNLEYTPTITPVVDMSQVEQASNWLQSAFNNDASMKLAQDSTLSIQNGSSNSLAQQVALLSDQVSRLADTDYSKLLDGVSVNVDARTTVDGKELRTTSAKYTAQKVNDDQRAYIMAIGGRV